MPVSESKRSLTGNDLALLEQGVIHMLNWWKAQPRSGYRKKQIEQCKELLVKLSDINQHAYPYAFSHMMPLDVGGETLMVLHAKNVAETRAAARRANHHA